MSQLPALVILKEPVPANRVDKAAYRPSLPEVKIFFFHTQIIRIDTGTVTRPKKTVIRMD